MANHNKNHNKNTNKNRNKNILFRRIIPWILILMMVVTMFLSVVVSMAAEVYWPVGIDTASESAIVMEADTGTILYEKAIDDRHYPASITKILTGLLAVENSDLDEVVTFSTDAVYKNEGSSSHIARDVDEQMTMEECLYGMLLESANECAYAIAEHIGGGDVSVFIDMMNARAKELGCTNSHFVNPNGLPDEDHYTSAHDMALIGQAAIQNVTLANIMSTKSYTIPPTNKHDEPTLLNNHHAMLNFYKTSRYLYEGCLGGKTGYTVDANNTLVTFAKRDGMTLICVVMCVDSPGHYTDTTSLFDYCFDNFRMEEVTDDSSLFSNLSKDSMGSIAENMRLTEVETKSRIVLPKAADVKDTSLEILPADSAADPQLIATLIYSYGDRQVGFGDLFFYGNTESTYPFHNLSSENTETEAGTDYLRIDFRLILEIIGIATAAVLLIIFLYRKISQLALSYRRNKAIRKEKKPKYKVIYRRRRRRGRRR